MVKTAGTRQCFIARIFVEEGYIDIILFEVFD
jgi:hypothetical protein